jgi:hypothetical protein
MTVDSEQWPAKGATAKSSAMIATANILIFGIEAANHSSTVNN